ncbi:ATP-binding cassette domain-containing protein, partial [Candidatus Poribacteria bacterium]|nr:ATP-binding cassette domain-containing protein [Candidatus Poribacteria bacterium]
MTHTPIIEMHGISKQFGHVQANDSVDFTLQRGEIHAIVGENGAGKSTLMKILYGLYQPDAGEIFVNGNRVNIPSPRRAMHLGLGMVQQHFTLIPVFTALQNIVLAKEPRKFGALLDYQQAEKRIIALAAQLGFDVPLNTPVESLPIGTQQHTEILKVLYHGADILIMDEPTAVLAPQEVEGLFNCMRNLKNEGRSLIIITHKLDEVMAIADTVTVMRRGQSVHSCPIADTDPAMLAEMMLGEPIIPTALTREQIENTAPMVRMEGVTLSGSSE